MSRHQNIQQIRNMNNSSAYSCSLLNSQIMLELFTAYYRHLIPQLLLLNFLVSLLFVPTVTSTLVSCAVGQSLLFASVHALGKPVYWKQAPNYVKYDEFYK